ncbi:TOBE domain-containing protein [Nostocoides japonicum]
MSFLGSVSSVGGTLVRPHDIVLERPAPDDTRANGPGRVLATIERVVRLGFEVRVELRDADGERFAAEVTRGVAQQLGLVAGEQVWAVAPSHAVRDLPQPPDAGVPADAAEADEVASTAGVGEPARA